MLAGLVPLAEPVMDRFRVHKRTTALLDFDDLILSARGLLRDHGEVRCALEERFHHVLVDEFQDTYPLQARPSDAIPIAEDVPATTPHARRPCNAADSVPGSSDGRPVAGNMDNAA